MHRNIWFDRQGQELTPEEANPLLSDMDYKRIALTEVTSASDPSIKHRVSTVWLGVNHQFGDGPPIIFETMVFGDDDGTDQLCQRYSTEAEATAGHVEIVASVAATVADDVVTDLADWDGKPLAKHPKDEVHTNVVKAGAVYRREIRTVLLTMQKRGDLTFTENKGALDSDFVVTARTEIWEQLRATVRRLDNGR